MGKPRIRTISGYTDLYVLINGTSIAVAAPEGTGVAGLCWYEPTDASLIDAGLEEGVYDGAFLHGNPASPAPTTDAEEGTFSGASWNGTTWPDDSSNGGGGDSSIDPTFVDDDHTWRFEADDQMTAENMITEVVGFDALVAMDFSKPIPDESSLNSGLIVTMSPSSGLVLGTVVVQANRRRISIPVVSAVAGTYIVVVKGVSVDSQEYRRRGVIIFETPVGT